MGFCFGVRRAIKILDKAAEEHGPLETLGAVVHNQRVVARLAEKGVRAVALLDEVRGVKVAIPSHGAGPQVWKEIEAKGLTAVDATCPIVARSQRVAQQLAETGFWVVIFGDAQHPEVKGVLGWAGGRGIATLHGPLPQEISAKLGLLSQTTQNQENFLRFAQEVLASPPARLQEVRIINTICQPTTERQRAALELARKVEVMLVIGSRNSANTRHLAELCSSLVETHLVEGADEVDRAWFQGHSRVGVTAGASTPDEAIEEVIGLVERWDKEPHP